MPIAHVLLHPEDYDNVIGYTLIDSDGKLVDVYDGEYNGDTTSLTTVYLIDTDIGDDAGIVKLPVRMVRLQLGRTFQQVPELFKSVMSGEAYKMNNRQTIEISPDDIISPGRVSRTDKRDTAVRAHIIEAVQDDDGSYSYDDYYGTPPGFTVNDALAVSLVIILIIIVGVIIYYW